jgi:hypothetical protein
MHPSLEAGVSLSVTYEACIHASEGAQVPHDHVGMIEFFCFTLSVFLGFGTNQWALLGESRHQDPSKGQLGQW